jgi:hypothetical protein
MATADWLPTGDPLALAIIHMDMAFLPLPPKKISH